MQINIRFDAESGMMLLDFGNEIKIAIHPKDALALAAGLAGTIAQIPALQPAAQPQLVIAGSMPQFGGRLNGRG